MNATVLGLPVRDKFGVPITEMVRDRWDQRTGLPVYKTVLGTGKGIDSRVGFTPSTWGRSGSCKCFGPGAEPDAILFHEMFHASRTMRGVAYMKKVNQHYPNEEEFLAVVITNIYQSEKGQALRGSYLFPFEGLADPKKFMDNVQKTNPSPRLLMEGFRNRQRAFYDALKDLRTLRFNPARDWDELRKKEIIDM